MDIVRLRRRRRQRVGNVTDDRHAGTDAEHKRRNEKLKTQHHTEESEPNGADRKERKCGANATNRMEAQQTVVIPSKYECILCLRLYHDPVSLPCGHTYCRGCVKRALTSKPQCPLCRKHCPLSAGVNPTNLTMLNSIKAQFGQEYAERGEEAKKDAIDEAAASRRALVLGDSVIATSDGSVSMPVLHLDRLIFPRQSVALYIAEPRYVTLANRCLSDTRRFVVFADNTPADSAVGSILEITNARVVEEAEYLLLCRCAGRCSLVGEFETAEGTDGLRYGKVVMFEDDEQAELEAGAEASAARRRDGNTDTAEARGEAGAGMWAADPLPADDVLGVELRKLADRTGEVISTCLLQLSHRQRKDILRRCGAPPKVRNSPLHLYRDLSFWIPSAVNVEAAGNAGKRRNNGTGSPDVCDRRQAMFCNRLLRHRLSEACEVIMTSDAVVGSTRMLRERGMRNLFCSPGTEGGVGGAGTRPPPMWSWNTVLLSVGILGGLYAWHVYSRA